MSGMKIEIGKSLVTLAKKYEETSYILLLTSLKNTGLSSGNTKIMFCTELKDRVMQIKNRAPFLF